MTSFYRWFCSKHHLTWTDVLPSRVTGSLSARREPPASWREAEAVCFHYVCLSLWLCRSYCFPACISSRWLCNGYRGDSEGVGESCQRRARCINSTAGCIWTSGRRAKMRTIELFCVAFLCLCPMARASAGREPCRKFLLHFQDFRN